MDPNVSVAMKHGECRWLSPLKLENVRRITHLPDNANY